jgi:cyclopropane fatty-acyl-phospholipid synthase-like methyltransferase
MIRLSRRHAPGARFEVASLAGARISTCDAVIAIGEVISYVASWRTVARFFRRVHDALPPRGLFIFDFIESGQRRTYPPKSRGGADWALVARADLSDGGRVLTRHLTMFRKIGGEYRRSREVHRVHIYPRATVAAALADAGFKAELRRSYGRHRLMHGDVAVVAERR